MKSHLLYYQYFIVLFSLSCLVQCTKEVLNPIPSYKTEIVLNSFLIQDSILTITLSKSIPINDGEVPRINDAVVVLFQDEVFYDSLVFTGDGIYTTHSTITKNSNYSIASYIENQLIEAYDFLPEAPVVLSLTRNDKGRLDEDGYYGTLELELNDVSLEADYYEIELIYISLVAEMYFPLIPQSESDRVILNENLPVNSSSFPFSDELFNGSIVHITFDYFSPKQIINGVESELDPDYILAIKIRKTSKNYYLYRRSLINHFESQQPGLWDGIGNPVNIYSNIIGGKGIFAAYSEIIDTLNSER